MKRERGRGQRFLFERGLRSLQLADGGGAESQPRQNMSAATEAIFLVRLLIGVLPRQRSFRRRKGRTASHGIRGFDRRGGDAAEGKPPNLLAATKVLRQGDVSSGEEHEKDGHRANQSPVPLPDAVYGKSLLHCLKNSDDVCSTATEGGQ